MTLSTAFPFLCLLASCFHFFLVVLFVILLLVVMCEVISTMEKASFKPKSPLDLALSLFQDFREAAASAALCDARAPTAPWQSTSPSHPPPPPQLPSLELSSFGSGAEPFWHSFKEATSGQ